MALNLTCPACAAVFALADDSRGKKAFCPKCGQPLVVTSAGVAKENERPNLALEADEAASRGGPGIGKEQPKSAPARRWGCLFLLLLGVPLLFLCVLLPGGVLAYLFVERGSSPDDQKPVAKNSGPVAGPPVGHQKAQPDPSNLVVDLGNGVQMEFVRIPAGEFLMGSPDSDADAKDTEKPQHQVKITKDFYLGKYPVTQEQHQAVMGNNPSRFTPAGVGAIAGTDARRLPVETVSWDDANEFCAKLTRLDKQKRIFHVPTEAQWEYAARAGSTTRYFFGNKSGDLPEYAWFAENSGNRPHEVGTLKPNLWGLYDMGGNVYQWCSDRLPDWHVGKDQYYAESPVEDPKGSPTGQFRAVRGGSWNDTPLACRSASRLTGGGSNPFGLMPLESSKDYRIGFRACIRLEE
jgi:formylglycine-generating enzyme required for sulfatase activity